jgi:hypothetical protein
LCVEFDGVIGQLVDLTQQHLFAMFEVVRHSVIIEVDKGGVSLVLQHGIRLDILNPLLQREVYYSKAS